MHIDRLEFHLENWADFMRKPTHKLGFPSKSLCISESSGSSDDEFEIMCEDMDMTSAIKIDSMIDSLKPPQRVAINHQWLKCSHVYPTQDMDYSDAVEALLLLADKRGLI